MKSLKYLVMGCLLAISAGYAKAQPIAENNWWYHFVTSGANILSGYAPDPNSVNLGSNIAGYTLGRYGVHGLMWGHLAWVRSPEYANLSTTDAQKRQNLENAKDEIRGVSMRCVVRTIQDLSITYNI